MKLATGAKDKVGYGAIIAMAEGVDNIIDVNMQLPNRWAFPILCSMRFSIASAL